MKTSDFSLSSIPKNFKELFADKKQFVFECIRLGILFFFFIWVFVPYFTLRETGFGVVAHFNLIQHSGFFQFVVMLAWFLTLVLFPLSILLGLKKYTHFVLLAAAGIEFIYWFITLIVYWVNLADLNAMNIPTMSLPLNIGFWFIWIHFGFVALLALLPKPFKAISDKIVIAATKGKPQPAPNQASEEPEVKEEPKQLEKVEEPVEEVLKQEAPAEEVSPEAPVVEEPKPEQPKPAKKPKKEAEAPKE